MKTPLKSEGELVSNYGKSKRKAEEFLWDFSIKRTSNRHFESLSDYWGQQIATKSSAQLFGYVADQKPFYTEGLINYIDVRDVAEIVLRSLQNEITNEQFILNAGSISYQDFFSAIANQLKVKAPRIGVPRFMVILGAVLENIISKLNGKPVTLTMETAKMAGSRKIYNTEKANKIFNIRHKTLEQSIEWTVKEMQKRGEL